MIHFFFLSFKLLQTNISLKYPSLILCQGDIGVKKFPNVYLVCGFNDCQINFKQINIQYHIFFNLWELRLLWYFVTSAGDFIF